MDTPSELTLQDVRCFQGEVHGKLRPITLLVGENSTGKTTFLGCYSVLHRMFSGPDLDNLLDFNEEPFAMGSFRDIVRSRRGPSGRIDQFTLGLTVAPGSETTLPPYRLLATLREEGSQPLVASYRFEFDGDSFLELQRRNEGTLLNIPGEEVTSSLPFDIATPELDYLIAGPVSATLRGNEELQPIVDYLTKLFSRYKAKALTRRRIYPGALRSLGWRLPELIPVAPLRSKPKRTYDPVRETASPEGEHIPMLMMRLDRTNKSHWNALHDGLVGFGREAGLFSDIKVKRHGGQMSDPFQLQVKVRSGPNANIMDVGYGVSQSLPILVDILAGTDSDRGTRGRRNRRRTFLLQQPEVHLHPRGQAELASLFIRAFREHGSRFLIETHSDFIVDRIRIEVRNGTLKGDDVSILYFEPNGNAVNIHNMRLDEYGNLEGAPAAYRDFFTRETDRLLGFAD